MEMKNNGKKRVVWQDIRPIKSKPSTIGIAPEINTKKPHKQIHLPKISKKILGIICIITLVICGIGVAYYFMFINKTESLFQNEADSTNNSDNPIALGEGTPEFSTILPTGKSISEFGGWTLISPKGTEPVYTYIDKIDGVSINVSEQKLPKDFKDNTEQKIENLAIGFNANEKISINGVIVHIGTSTEGPQSVIFSKNDLLILIKSDSSISSNQWTEYINSLQ